MSVVLTKDSEIDQLRGRQRTNSWEDVYDEVRQILLPPVTKKKVEIAKEILKNHRAWSPTKCSNGEELGTSVDTWKVRAIDYKEEVKKTIQAAERVLKERTVPTSIEPLTFTKEAPGSYKYVP